MGLRVRGFCLRGAVVIGATDFWLCGLNTGARGLSLGQKRGRNTGAYGFSSCRGCGLLGNNARLGTGAEQTEGGCVKSLAREEADEGGVTSWADAVGASRLRCFALRLHHH